MNKKQRTKQIQWLWLTTVSLVLTACSSLPEPEVQPSVYAMAPTEETELGREVLPLEAEHPDMSGFYPLSDGKEALVARLLLMKEAEQSIDLQYYIWHEDLTGKLMHYQLLDSADRGVRVRILLDDLDTAGKDLTLRALDAHENIEIRLFNPFSGRSGRLGDYTTDTKRINRRMHNKTLTVDNVVSVFGGRNIGDEYFDATEDVGFNDLDMAAIGPVVREISSQFDVYWNSLSVYPLSTFYPEPLPEAEVQKYRESSEAFIEEARTSKYADALRNLAGQDEKTVSARDFTWGTWKLVYDLPSKVNAEDVKKDTHLAPTLFEAMGQSQSELLIVSPYFVPGPEFTEFLVKQVEKGVSVKILTNSLAANDVPLVHSGYMRYREDLIGGGVDLYEFKSTLTREQRKELKKRQETNAWTGSNRASLHGKFLAFDQRYLFVGSFNLDGRSVALNTELGVFFEHPKMATLISEAFADDRINEHAYILSLDSDDDIWWTTEEDGKMVSFDKEPDTSWWTRTKTGFMSWIVPESQL